MRTVTSFFLLHFSKKCLVENIHGKFKRNSLVTFTSEESSKVKCLDCTINPLIHTYSGGASVSSKLLPLVCVKWRVFSKQHLILTMSKRPCNLTGVAGFKKQTELYPYKCRSKTPTSSTFTFNRLSNSNVKELTTCLALWCFC